MGKEEVKGQQPKNKQIQKIKTPKAAWENRKMCSECGTWTQKAAELLYIISAFKRTAMMRQKVPNKTSLLSCFTPDLMKIISTCINHPTNVTVIHLYILSHT